MADTEFRRIIEQAEAMVGGVEGVYVLDEEIDDDDDDYWVVQAVVHVPKRKPMWVNLRATSEGLRSLRRDRPGAVVPACSRCLARLPNWLQGMCVECAAKNPSPLPAWAEIAKLWR